MESFIARMEISIEGVKNFKIVYIQELLVAYWLKPEEVGHCMLPYIRDQILELVNESLLVAEL